MWDFFLSFRLPLDGSEPEAWVDRLYEAGCDDALVATGRLGFVGLRVTRAAETAQAAIDSAIADVLTAIPGAELTEIEPDLVGLSDIAERLGRSRQNIRKYLDGEIKSVTVPFPMAVASGTTSLWRLLEVLQWFDAHTDLKPTPSLLELARAVARTNGAVQQRRLHALLAAE